MTPFYVNFGAVFFPRRAFDAVAPAYLRIRPQLMDRMHDPDFSGQAAITLALASTRVPSWPLPMRYNFPNDPLALELYPDEASRMVLLHYLRTTNFDRHRIFLDAERYERFLGLPLDGVDRLAQALVRATLGDRFPFG
jgi:hypothetical protein